MPEQHIGEVSGEEGSFRPRQVDGEFWSGHETFFLIEKLRLVIDEVFCDGEIIAAFSHEALRRPRALLVVETVVKKPDNAISFEAIVLRSRFNLFKGNRRALDLEKDLFLFPSQVGDASNILKGAFNLKLGVCVLKEVLQGEMVEAFAIKAAGRGFCKMEKMGAFLLPAPLFEKRVAFKTVIFFLEICILRSYNAIFFV